MSNYLALRSSAAPTLTVSTLLAKSITFQSTMISLGQSTNQSNYFNGGTFTSGWGSTLNAYNTLSSINDVVMTQSGQYQYALQGTQSSMATSQVSRSTDSGITWQTLNNTGLPVSTYAYQSTTSGYPSYSNMSLSATGQYALAAVKGGQLYLSNNAVSATPVFTPANMGGYPSVYLPFENSVADSTGNSVMTATGAIAFNVPGKVGTNAMNLVNAAGSTAAQYVRGTWTGASNFTVSFWFNPQTLNSTAQLIFSAYTSYCAVLINASNQLSALVPNGGGSNYTSIGTSSTLTVNTWYNVTLIFQTNGLCSLYLNNSLVGSVTNTQGVGSLTMSAFELSGYDTNQSYAFNGYIDDFRLYNFAAPNAVNPVIYLPMEGSVTDMMGGSTITVTGSPGYVSGVVGSQALKLMNPAGGTAVQYVRGTWTSPSIYSVSGWFNLQSYSASGNQYIFSTGGITGPHAVLVYVNTNNQLVAQVPNSVTISTGAVAALNTWYYFLLKVYPSGNVCSLYFNNAVYTATASATATSTGTFGLGTFDSGGLTSAFNGYIDDIRIYNADVPYSPIVPMNWSQTAVSSTGQYMLAACNSGGVFQSSNYGASWTQLTAYQIASIASAGQATMALNYPTFQPNQSSLAASTWTQSGVTWTASASTVLGGGIYDAYRMFNNNYDSNSRWVPSSASYSTAGNTSGINTVIQGGIGSVQGDYLQLQSSVPIVMVSYQFATGPLTPRLPKTYYIAGSNDGTTWYPIQYGAAGAVTTTAISTLVPGIITVNSASVQTFGSSTITTTTYSTTTTAYFYFRLFCLSTYNASADYLDIGEWVVNFIRPTPLYVAPSSSIVTITPQQAGLTSTTWTASGVNWTASASSVLGGWPIYMAFNNKTGDGWLCDNVTQRYTNGATNANAQSTTILGGIGLTAGEWLQIESSVPLVMSSFAFGIGPNAYPATNTPKTYYIVGSNDGNNWYPIQYGNFTISAFTSVSPYIMINSTGTVTQPLSGTMTGSIATTGYSFSSNAYTRFRLIGTSLMTTTSAGTYMEVGEWFINANTATPTLALAPSNTSLLTISPQQTGLPSSGTSLVASPWTTVNGISWIASASSVYSATYPVSYAFNNTASSFWTGAGSYTTSGNTASSRTFILGGIGSIQGDWLQIQSSVPLVMPSYQFAMGGAVNYMPKTYYIVGSNDGTTWYPIQYGSGGALTTTPANTLVPGTIIVYSTGIPVVQTFGSSTITTTAYSTAENAYTYFRLIGVSAYNTGIMEIGEWYINFTAATPNPVNTLAISNANMTVSASGMTSPNLTGLLSSVWTANGVNWSVSASSILSGGWYPYTAFNNSLGTDYNVWASSIQSYSTTGSYTGSISTVVSGIGTVLGEWLQLQSSVPLVMSSYIMSSAHASNPNRSYVIAGSNDGITWYAIQSATWAANPFGAYTTLTSYINANFSGTQTLTSSSTQNLMTTSYTTSTNAYLYFRAIGTSNFGTGGTAYYEIGEWFINFQTSANYISPNNGATWTTALTPANAPLLATTGSYVLTGGNQTAYLYSNGISGSYTTPTLTGINANINGASMSTSGQYVVILTQGTSNNVFYSTNYGVSFTALTIGNAALTSCAMSADGSYLTVSNDSTVYTLNRNAQGFSVALGNQAGFMNQAQNAIAIGNQAGLINQSANSIILNASGTALNSYSQGFYVAPIASYTASYAGSFNLLGYGADSQIIQVSTVTIGATGNVGIGTAMTVLQSGNVGIGTTLPGYPLHVAGNVNLTGSILYNGVAITTGTGSIWNAGSGGVAYYNGGNVGIGTATPAAKLSVIPADGTTNYGLLSFINSSGYGIYVNTTAINSRGNTLDWYTYDYNFGAITARPILTMRPEGLIGIGTTLPSFTLHTRVTSYSAPLLVVDAGGQAADSTSVPRGIGKPLIGIGANSWSNISSGDYYGIGFGYNANSSSNYYAAEIGFLIQTTSGGEYGDLVFSTRPTVTSSTIASERMRITSAGYVGIGVASPIASLHIVGNSNNTSGGQNPPLCLTNSGNSKRWDVGPNASNGDFVMFYNGYGPWINSGSPGSWNYQSDLRLKDEIEPMTNCLDKINALRPVSYRWKSHMDSRYRSFGLIAQEVNNVIPEIVNGLHDSTYGEIYGIAYTSSIPFLIGAVKELSSAVTTLQATNTATSIQMTAHHGMADTLHEENTQASTIAALEAQVAHLSVSLAGLLTWAQAQGFSG